jgi:hypothetical protein
MDALTVGKSRWARPCLKIISIQHLTRIGSGSPCDALFGLADGNLDIDGNITCGL